MSAEGVDLKRRRFLTVATSVVGAVGVVAVAVPFVSSMQPSAKAKAAGAPVEADLSKMEPGQMIRVKWRGKPVWVVRRTDRMLQSLPAVRDELRDPDSSESLQPPYCTNPTRAIKEDYFVAIGICTHLGCSPTYRPDVAPQDLGPDWKGGFFCPCHGSTFDLAGRVYKGVPAPLNLEIPPHQYIAEHKLLVGDDGGAA
jgi:ubiquinol-cytochrome c reductase iron-sulfur subunit